MMTELRIRRMEEQDLEQVSRNEALCFSQPWSRNAFADVIKRPEAIFLVAQMGDRIVGHCGVTDILGEGSITNVAVHPDYRGRRIGERLLHQLLQEGEAAGISAFTLEVRLSNQIAAHMYNQAGFIVEGIRPGFYDKPREDALIMWKR